MVNKCPVFQGSNIKPNVDFVHWWIIWWDDWDIESYLLGLNLDAKSTVDSLANDDNEYLALWEVDKMNAALYQLYNQNRGNKVTLVSWVKFTNHLWYPLRAISANKMLGTGFQNLWWKTDSWESLVTCAIRELSEEANGIKITKWSLKFDGMHIRELKPWAILAIARFVSASNVHIEQGVKNWTVKLGSDVEDAFYCRSLFERPGLHAVTAETYWDERKRGYQSEITKMLKDGINRKEGIVSTTRNALKNSLKSIIDPRNDVSDFFRTDQMAWSKIEFSLYQVYMNAVSDCCTNPSSDRREALLRANDLAIAIASKHGILRFKGMKYRKFVNFIREREWELSRHQQTIAARS